MVLENQQEAPAAPWRARQVPSAREDGPDDGWREEEARARAVTDLPGAMP
jgi:hypothetical protein